MAKVCSRPTPTFVLFCLSYFIFSIHVRHTFALSFNLSFSDPRSPNLAALINFTRDAFLSPNTLELTRNSRNRNSTDSTGRAQYTQTMRLWDRTTGEMASFTTTFSFQITPDPSNSHLGDGLAFFLGDPSSAGIPPMSTGSSLGLLPDFMNGTGAGRIVAVEFDTYQNQWYADISGNHVGIDVNSLISTASTDTTSPGNNLTSGSTMVATVRYENATELLVVDLRISNTSYRVSATVDLRSYLPEDVAVGFSAATGAAGEQHQILTWSFNSTLEPKTTTMEPAPPPRSSVDDATTSKHRKKAAVPLVAVLVPLLVLVACAAVGLLLWRRHKKRKSNEASDDDQEQDYRAELERGVAASGPRRYTYRELAAATGEFAEDAKLGRGGSVYLGKLADRPVAIKVFSSESSAQGRKEFEAEVRIISRLKHRNLVQLLGWCDSRNGLLLVYELVAQGSLDKQLHSSDRLLTWQERYKIILGLGSALRYLHQEWEQCVVHGDIKPSNIMLDESLGAKLGDFGLARLGDHGGGGWHTTKAVMGTAGYIDPEFVNTGRPSTRSDVYSFGIVLLELACGRPPVILKEGGEPPFLLLRWVWSLYGKNAALDAVDERFIRGDDDDDEKRVEMERVLVVGLWCAHPDSGERPSIAQAMHVLQSQDTRLPTLQPQMYRSVSDLAVVAPEYSSAFSIESYTGDSSKPSSDSSSSALLGRSKDLA